MELHSRKHKAFLDFRILWRDFLCTYKFCKKTENWSILCWTVPDITIQVVWYTYFAAPMSRSLSCFPQTHQSGRSMEGWQSFNLSSNSGWINISSLILFNKSTLCKHRLARSSDIGSTFIASCSGKELFLKRVLTNLTDTWMYSIRIGYLQLN